MDDAFERKLAEKYPFMRKRKSLAQQNAEGFVEDLYSAFGCECNNGWYDLLDGLCSDIQRVYEDNNVPVDINVLQVKEKFGTLSFYAAVSGPENVRSRIYELIADAERKSKHVCEKCGKPGTLRTNNGWMSVMCDACHLALLNRMKEISKM